MIRRRLGVPNGASFYVYIIADLTDKLVTQQQSITSRRLRIRRFFGFNANYNAYIEIISYDKLLGMQGSEQIIFQKLRLPLSRSQ